MPDSTFSVTAIVAIRNGAYYFNRLCKHCRDNGIALAVIDNESEDNLQELIDKNLDVVVRSSSLTYDGVFDLTRQLRAKQALAESLNANWIIHLDVDELLFSDIPGENLLDAFRRVDAQGHDAINFDEFVFLPVDRFKDYDSDNFHEMRWYYFFEPRQSRLIRAFRSDLRIRIESGGHDVEGAEKIYPQNMIMRHYMFKNKSHVKLKYKLRQYSEGDVRNKFHGNRIPLQNNQLFLPARKSLICCSKNQWNLDKSMPQNKHFWQWQNK